MSLIKLAIPFQNVDQQYDDRVRAGVVNVKLKFVLNPAKFRTTWVDTATYASIACNIPNEWGKQIYGIHDRFGRKKRTELWV